jgi:hypothetical protein
VRRKKAGRLLLQQAEEAEETETATACLL